MFELFHFLFQKITECGGPLKPEVVQSTGFGSTYPASSVLILGEEDGTLDSGKENYWLAENYKTTGQGFALKLDICKRSIAGIQLKNIGGHRRTYRATKEYNVSGSLRKDGPWKLLVQGQLNDTRDKHAPLVNFTFEEPAEIQFLRFELVSYWGYSGGGLQYFAAIPATTKFSSNSTSKEEKYDKHSLSLIIHMCLPDRKN